MQERFGAKTERARALRFHCQTAGMTLTAQQPLNNIARVTVQTLAAVLGGCQSLHTNSYDEALGLPASTASASSAIASWAPSPLDVTVPASKLTAGRSLKMPARAASGSMPG